MKIKITNKSYEEVLALRPEPHIKPKAPNWFFKTLMKIASLPDLWSTRFSLESEGLEKISSEEPCLYLMNHSSFIDLEIVASILYPRPFNIVATSDGFIGKPWLMRQIGCIPTKKFIPDLMLVRDMEYALNTLRSSVVLFPEAGYSFDGTSTLLPESLGKCIKFLKVPVVMIRTEGAFARDPLYNNLQRRRVKVSANMTCLFSKDEVETLDEREIQRVIEEQFSFDSFRWQKEKGVRIKAPFRADYLNRLLYKCPHCREEGRTEGRGTKLLCHACGKEYEMTVLGEMRATEGETAFPHIPDWYRWERESVRAEILRGDYRTDVPVDILVAVDLHHLYRVGEGRLVHDRNGFSLTGCDGKLKYQQKPMVSYSLNADFNWYEIGDMVCIGNNKMLYYCFPKTKGDIVAKMRLATEEIYQIARAEKQAKKENEQ